MRSVLRWVAYAIGVALAAIGTIELGSGTSWPAVRAALGWLAGGVVLHDGVLVPITILVGLALARAVPGHLRPVVQGALIVSAMITLPLLPLLSERGVDASNPSQQPLPYRQDLLVVLAGVWVIAAAVGVRRTRVARAAARTLLPRDPEAPPRS